MTARAMDAERIAALNFKPRCVPWFAYGFVMRVAHRFHWHYAPPCYPDGDTMLWCRWCGMRDVVKRRGEVIGNPHPYTASADSVAAIRRAKGGHDA